MFFRVRVGSDTEKRIGALKCKHSLRHVCLAEGNGTCAPEHSSDRPVFVRWLIAIPARNTQLLWLLLDGLTIGSLDKPDGRVNTLNIIFIFQRHGQAEE